MMEPDVSVGWEAIEAPVTDVKPVLTHRPTMNEATSKPEYQWTGLIQTS